MIRKIIIASLLAAAVIATTACQNNLRNEIKEVEGFIKAYNDLSEIDFDDLEDWVSEYVELEPELDDSSSNITDEYAPFPHELYQYDKSGTNPFSGNRYFVYGFVRDYNISFDGMDAYQVFTMDDDGYGDIVYDEIVMVGSDLQKRLGEFSEETGFILYFKYVGFSKELDSHYGIYEFHEMWF
ncbi:MAG: hypothetical protein FWD05_08340 [Oscillospiraceae bacterium]|nr:hypothetical protein [Oscillospiraceae bacterium]